jgi:ThiF family
MDRPNRVEDVLQRQLEINRLIAQLFDRMRWSPMPTETIAAAPPVAGTSEEFELSDVFARQRSIPLELPNLVAVVGCGGVGSWIAYFLALAGCPHLALFDDDTVSEHNLNRMPYGPGSVGKLKTESLKLLILAHRPRCKVECYPNFDVKFAETIGFGQNGDTDIDWIVASTDSWASRQEAYRYHCDHCTNYVEAAAEGEFGSIAGCPAEWATDEETQPGYASVPVWIGPAVSAAVMACTHILHGCISSEVNARFGWDRRRIRFHYRDESQNESPRPSYAGVVVTDGMAYAGGEPRETGDEEEVA